MSTRSMIGRKNSDGTITAIYCHWDGYPTNNGKLLTEHYTDPTKIAGLLALGSLSALAPELGSQHPFDGPTDPAHELWCLAYGRDRGEANIQAETYTDRAAYALAGYSACAEYLYLFVAGRWVVAECRPAAPHMGAWHTVAAVLAHEDAAAAIPTPPVAAPIPEPIPELAPVAPIWPTFLYTLPIFNGTPEPTWHEVTVSIEPGDMIKARYGGFSYNRVDKVVTFSTLNIPGYCITRPGGANEPVWVQDIIGADDAVLVTLGTEHEARIYAELRASLTPTTPDLATAQTRYQTALHGPMEGWLWAEQMLVSAYWAARGWTGLPAEWTEPELAAAYLTAYGVPLTGQRYGDLMEEAATYQIPDSTPLAA